MIDQNKTKEEIFAEKLELIKEAYEFSCWLIDFTNVKPVSSIKDTVITIDCSKLQYNHFMIFANNIAYKLKISRLGKDNLFNYTGRSFDMNMNVKTKILKVKI